LGVGDAGAGGAGAASVFEAHVAGFVAVDVAEVEQLGEGAERPPAAPAGVLGVVGGDEVGAEALVGPAVASGGGGGHQLYRRHPSRRASRLMGRRMRRHGQPMRWLPQAGHSSRQQPSMWGWPSRAAQSRHGWGQGSGTTHSDP
jgi:hypothetical protein